MKRKLKKTHPTLIATRLESWALPGVPDLLLCDESGNFHFVELKHTNTKQIKIRPQQVAWLDRHKHASAWILVRQDVPRIKTWNIKLFRADQAISLALEDYASVPPVLVCEDREDWSPVIQKILTVPFA